MHLNEFLKRIRLALLSTVAAAAVFTAAFAPTVQSSLGVPQGEAAFRAFDLATTADIDQIRNQAEAGDPAAQYALSLIALHGLRDQPVDLAASAVWLEKASQDGPRSVVTESWIAPSSEGRLAQLSMGERRNSAIVEAFKQAYVACVGDAIGRKPDPGACGSNSADRARRRAAWLSALERRVIFGH